MSSLNDKIIKLLRGTGREHIEDLIDFMLSSTYFVDPASSNHHSNFPGGLAVHSYSDMELCYKFREALKLDIPDDSIIITALTHDFCKIGTYEICSKNIQDDFGRWNKVKYYKNIPNVLNLAHGEISARMVSKIIELSDTEYEAISNHMSNWGYGVDKYAVGRCYSSNPLALTLALADQYSSFALERVYADGEIPFG